MSDTSVCMVVVPALLLAGCAPNPSPNRSGPRTEDVVRSTGSFDMSVQLNRTDAVIMDTVGVDPARAWTELPAVYQALGLPMNERDAARRRVAATAFQPRRIDGQLLSRFLDCGRGPTAGQYADTYQVYLWVETRVVSDGPDPSNGTVQTKLTANARPRAVSGNPVPCQSLGRLERRISELLHARLAASGG